MVVHAALRMARILAVGVVTILLAAPLLAQGTGGRILGRVSDTSGAVLPNVKVSLINEATDVSRDAQTNSNGDYTFIEVPVGEYRLEFDLQGFKKNVRRGVTLQVNQVLTLNMTLQVGATQEVVDVTSEAPLVDTTSTQLGAVVDDRTVTELPLNERDTYQFLQLQPGVQTQLGGNSDLFYGSGSAGSVSVNGGRGRANNFSVNGGDANDQFVNLPTVQPSPDSIQEFRVLTNTFDAEYGRNSGAVVNVVTKSGTNQWHGDVYEFFRNKVLNARGFFDSVKPAFNQNQFGGTFGGPVKKDKTFFFTSYEGRRIRQGRGSDTVAVPTPQEIGGDFSAGPTFTGNLSDPNFATMLNSRPGCAVPVPAPGSPIPWSTVFPGNQIPKACMDPLAVDLLHFVPPANPATGLFQSVITGADRQDQFTARFDHKINDKQQFSAYYYFTDHKLFQPFSFFQQAGANVPGFGSNVGERFQQWNLSHTWVVSNNSVNEFRFTYMREGQLTFQHPQRTSDIHSSCFSLTGSDCFGGSSITGINPGLGSNREGLPFIVVSGGFQIGNNFEGELPQVGNTFQWSDNFTKVSGNHTFKFGGDVRRQRFDQFLFFNVNGEYVFNGATSPNAVGFQDNYASYLLGIPDSYSQGSAQSEHVRSSSLYLYAQDSWKLKPNVTLNYGLRWELDTPIADISGHVQTFRPGQVTTQFPCQLSTTNEAALGASTTNCNLDSPDPVASAVFPTGLVFPGDKGVPPGLTSTYYHAFAPRIGLAWSPSADHGWLSKLTGGPGKTSIRAGWGMFYNPIEQLVLEQFSAEPPFGGSNFITSPQFNTPFLDQGGNQFPNPFVNGVLTPKPMTPQDWSAFRPIVLFGEFQPHLRTQYSDQYNLTIQREIGRDVVLQVGYVGSQAHRLLISHDLNASNAQTCLDLNSLLGVGTCGPGGGDNQYLIPASTPVPAGFTLHLPYGGANNGPLNITFPTASTIGSVSPTGITLVGLRPFSSPQCKPLTGVGCPSDGVPVFSNIYAQDTIANSNYNSLQVMVEKRFSHGLQLQGSYTWSKSIDQGSSFEDILNPFNFAATRSLSLFDARNRFVFSYFWEPPIPKYNGFLGKVANGWALSGIVTFQSGFPIRIVSFDDNELNSSTFDFIAAGEPDQVRPFVTQNPRNGGCALGTGPTSLSGNPCQAVQNLYFDPNIFNNDPNIDPTLTGRYGNAKRTICCGPGIQNFDISLQKNTPISERFTTQFRAEFFNAFNHTQFFNPDGSVSDGADFGRIKRARDPRLIQFAMKLIF